MFCRLTSCQIRRHLLMNKTLIDRSFVRKSHFYAIKLKNKRLIRVSGADSFIYLQSLLSNDLRHLLTDEEVPQRGCVYSFLLSALGKVLADLFVYRSAGNMILEVDSCLANALKRLLISYEINRNISVESVEDFHLWALVPKSQEFMSTEDNDLFLNEVISDDFQLVADPRIPQMGYRLLTRIGGKGFEDIIKFIDDKRIEEGNGGHYRTYRYKLGVSEGYADLLSGFYFPFECNGDYLNAVSVDKGLYTSEEKTIKVYMRQPIVKRIVPIRFLCTESQLSQHSPPPLTDIRFKNSIIGSLKNRKGFDGIASLKVLNNTTPLKHNGLVHIQSGIKLKTWIPEWWPQRVNQIYLPKVDYPNNLFNIISN